MKFLKKVKWKLVTLYLLVRRFLLIQIGKAYIFFETPLTIDGYLDLTQKVELHMVLNHANVLPTIGALSSFYRFSRVAMNTILYIDASVSKLDQKLLTYHIPKIKFATYGLKKGRVENKQSKLNHTWQWQKLFTPKKKFNLPKMLILDSDVLFFERPTEIINWVKFGKSHIFMEDTGSYVGLSKGEFKYYFGLNKIDKNINTGIVGIVNPNSLTKSTHIKPFLRKFWEIVNDRLIPDYEEIYLKNSYHLLEQTAFVYLMSNLGYGSFRLLKKNFYTMITSFREKNSKKMPIALHYAGIGNKLLKDQFFVDYLKARIS